MCQIQEDIKSIEKMLKLLKKIILIFPLLIYSVLGNSPDENEDYLKVLEKFHFTSPASNLSLMSMASEDVFMNSTNSLKSIKSLKKEAEEKKQKEDEEKK